MSGKNKKIVLVPIIRPSAESKKVGKRIARRIVTNPREADQYGKDLADWILSKKK